MVQLMAEILHYLGCINNNSTKYCRISVPPSMGSRCLSQVFSCNRAGDTGAPLSCKHFRVVVMSVSSCRFHHPFLPFLLSGDSFPCPLGMFETAVGFASYIQVLQNQHATSSCSVVPTLYHTKHCLQSKNLESEEYVGPPF